MSDLVVVRLRGGLGNQLFQYATAAALARERGCELRLDATALRGDRLRSLELDGLQVEVDVATRDEILRTKGGDGALGALRRRLDSLRPYFRRHHFIEPRLAFDPNLRRARRTVYLDGYWQSHLYFRDHAAVLRAEIVPRVALPPALVELERSILSEPSVSLHVRRGDYVDDVETARIYRTLGEDYYRKAVARLREHLPRARFFVFSDDPPRARAAMSWLPEASFVSSSESSPQHDLWLMSRCRHHITANSSFSWWAAWLSPSPDKRVLAPREWTNDGRFANPDRYPDGWELL